mgnify:CR=1 FL=1|tara:strand:+ start:719 stop:1351 length:633 start_codon:yes stop_codon:yes gene_type:complete
MKQTLFIIALIISTNVLSQTQGSFFDLADYSNVDISATSNGTYKSINVKISNFTNENIKVDFPEGGIFVNKSNLEQNLLVLFYDYLVIEPNKSSYILIGTACANPKKKIPSKGRTNWSYSYDKKVGDLIRYYKNNRSFIEMVTGPEFHETQAQRHNFLQMCVWVYYNADKEQILTFSTKYIFGNNKEQAKEFIDLFYPMAVTFINVYKEL